MFFLLTDEGEDMLAKEPRWCLEMSVSLNSRNEGLQFISFNKTLDSHTANGVSGTIGRFQYIVSHAERRRVGRDIILPSSCPERRRFGHSSVWALPPGGYIETACPCKPYKLGVDIILHVLLSILAAGPDTPSLTVCA